MAACRGGVNGLHWAGSEERRKRDQPLPSPTPSVQSEPQFLDSGHLASPRAVLGRDLRHRSCVVVREYCWTPLCAHSPLIPCQGAVIAIILMLIDLLLLTFIYLAEPGLSYGMQRL